MQLQRSQNTTPQSKPKKQIRATTTWHLKPKPENLADWVAKHDLGPLHMYEPQPEELDIGPIPYHPIWRENVFILRWLLLPIIAQWGILNYTGEQRNELDFGTLL